MTFADTTAGDLVVITIHIENRKLSLESKILNVIDNSIIVEPFTVNNAILNFTRRMEIEMMVVHPDTTPIYWQRVYVELKTYHEANCHVITTNLPGIKMNRRNNFRVSIGQSVRITGVGDQAINGTLKDLSSTGFAILVNKDIEIEMHKKITVEYKDNSMQKYFELTGRPIRKQEMEHYYCYGCIQDRRSADLENYLSQKQMENRPNYKKEI